MLLSCAFQRSIAIWYAYDRTQVNAKKPAVVRFLTHNKSNYDKLHSNNVLRHG
ncbi:MAG: hypothetical protein NZM34_04340 [Bernardetiaceae bacterium]|nr:hypothetical protein [Bernardetiaceae bacterium]